MSSIQKITNLKGISYRVFIRRKGIKTITKTFPSKELASQFVLKLEGDRQLQLAFGGKSSSKITFNELSVDYLLNGFLQIIIINKKIARIAIPLFPPIIDFNSLVKAILYSFLR